MAPVMRCVAVAAHAGDGLSEDGRGVSRCIAPPGRVPSSGIGSRSTMDSFEFNKIAGAILGTLMLTMALGLFAGFVFSPGIPAKPGYELPNAPAEGADAAPAASAEASVPLPVLLAKASVEKGPGRREGLRRVPQFREGRRRQGRAAALGRGRPSRRVDRRLLLFDALSKKGGNWSLDDINKFITNRRPMWPARRWATRRGKRREARRHPGLPAHAVRQPGTAARS